MKLVIVAGPPSVGKTAVIRQIIRAVTPSRRVAFLKIDVVAASEDEELAREFSIPVKKVYSGDLCPDHAGMMVIPDAVAWAAGEHADLLIIESAGLCLRCTPYTTQSLGVVVLSAIAGIHSPKKMAPMIALADVAVVTRIDLVTQAEKEVFRERIREINASVEIVETNAIQGTGLRYLIRSIDETGDIVDPATITMRGIPPLGVCTVCIGKTTTGWSNHFGIVRKLEGADFVYRGE